MADVCGTRGPSSAGKSLAKGWGCLADGMADGDEAKRWLLQGAMDLETARATWTRIPMCCVLLQPAGRRTGDQGFSLAQAGHCQRPHDILGTLKASPALQQVIQLRDASLQDAFDTEPAREAVPSASGILAACGQLIAALEAAAGP